MSSKSKWDQPAPTDDKSPTSAPPSNKDGNKSASDAAAAAAAIAAKIAAQFASGALKDEAAFQKDIDINDVRNRYMLTKGSTQQQVGFQKFLTLFCSRTLFLFFEIAMDSEGGLSLSCVCRGAYVFTFLFLS